jgi:hypothetical protein
MKHIIALMLLCSINQALHAQDNSADKVFNLPDDNLHRQFVFDLGEGNRMLIELEDLRDLKQVRNVDSIVRVFINDLKPLKDSLTDELVSYRIDYLVEQSEHKKIRLQRFHANGNSFTVNNGDVAALKLEQDTINLLGTIHFVAKYTMRPAFNASRRYRIRFFLNNIHELGDYLDGTLNTKVAYLADHMNTNWTWNNLRAHPPGDTSITSRQPKGLRTDGDFLELNASVQAGNYKQYFVPAFSLSAGVTLAQNGFFKRNIVVSWEPNFFFAKNAQGKLKTYRNDFLELMWGQGPIKDHDTHKESSLLFVASYAYLIHRSGDFYTPNTQRLGLGRLSLFDGKAKLEPLIYFDHFFKGVTPGLRWIQRF